MVVTTGVMTNEPRSFGLIATLLDQVRPGIGCGVFSKIFGWAMQDRCKGPQILHRERGVEGISLANAGGASDERVAWIS